MGFQYTAVQDQPKKSSLYITSGANDSFEALEDQSIEQSGDEDHRRWRAGDTFSCPTQSIWIWLVHVLLFLTSFTLFILSTESRNSTLEHVRRFSAWCKYDQQKERKRK